MRKWDITSRNRSLNVDAIQAYNTIFNSSIGSTQWKVIWVLFVVDCPLGVMESRGIEP
jgi:hypothetical protein